MKDKSSKNKTSVFKKEFGNKLFNEIKLALDKKHEHIKIISIGIISSDYTKDVYLLVDDIHTDIHMYIHVNYYTNSKSYLQIKIHQYGKEITMPTGLAFDEHRRDMRINTVLNLPK